MVQYRPHPLSPLSVDETTLARDIVLSSASADEVVQFRMIYAQEPEKAQLVKFLELEHSGSLQSESPRPPRLARVHYLSTAKSNKDRRATEIEASVNLNSKQVVKKDVLGTEFLAGLST